MDSAELSRFSNLVGRIYEGATHPARWDTDILPALCAYVDVPLAALYSPMQFPKDGGFAFAHGYSQQMLDLYTTEYHKIDILAQTAFAKGLVFEGNVIIDADIMPRAQIVASDYHKTYLSREAMASFMTSVIFGAHSASGAEALVLVMWRREGQAMFTEADRSRMNLLLPHLSRSLGVMQRLRAAELSAATTQASLDKLACGVLLVNYHGEVVFTNRAVRKMFNDDRGLALRGIPGASGLGRLSASHHGTNTDIDAAIRVAVTRDPFATTHFSSNVSVPRTDGAGNFILQFSALGKHGEYGGGRGAPAAIVLVTDTHQPVAIDAGLLRQTYGLTPAEARVASAMMQFATLGHVADHLSLSVGTVRTHVKRIYAKLGVDTRARFAKLMAGLASPAAP